MYIYIYTWTGEKKDTDLGTIKSFQQRSTKIRPFSVPNSLGQLVKHGTMTASSSSKGGASTPKRQRQLKSS